METSKGHVAFFRQSVVLYPDGREYELYRREEGYFLVPEYYAVGVDTGVRYTRRYHWVGDTLDAALMRIAMLGYSMVGSETEEADCV